MTKPLEFSTFFQLLNAIKKGDKEKTELLNITLSEYKTGVNAQSFLQELGQIYLMVGFEEILNYTKSIDLQFIGYLTKEEWEDLAIKNNCELPVHLANTMIKFVKDKQLISKLALKWKTSEREIQKHVRPMSAYITEGLIDVLE